MIDQLRWSVCPGADGSTVVLLRGELDCAYEDAVADFLAGIVAQGTRIVIDASELTFLDSSGLRCLVRASTEAAGRGCRLTVVNASEMVRRLIEITGLERELLGDVARLHESDEVDRPVAS